MGKIHVLHQHISNQIAAGEVVERPASVIKELLENAIDAHARSISIEIKNGGMDYIRVADNGDGIPAEDCLLAFERHATSKIANQEDLSHIETLGFRGEALASIASVAQVEMRTCYTGQETGMRIRMEGGSRKLFKPFGCAKGTAIVVENLFYNVPARRKFLKSARSEASYIGDFVSRMILSRPDIAFTYTNNDKVVYKSAGNGKLRDAMYCIYGEQVLGHLKPVAYDDGYMKIEGYIGTPDIARPNRNQQSFFLNKRYIRSMLLSHALQQAYDTRLMGHQYPFAVVSLTISPYDVDVNVHPNKLDVRFSQEDRVKRALSMAFAAALETQAIPTAMLPAQKTKAGGTLRERDDVVQAPDKMQGVFAPDIAQQFAMQPTNAPLHVKEGAVSAVPHFTVLAQRAPAPVQADPGVALPLQAEAGEAAQIHLDSEPITIVGQVYDTYWFVQKGAHLFVIDQHAAHERKLYEAMMSSQEAQVSQPLLVPEMIQLTHMELDLLRQFADVLEELGFDVQPFGATTVRLFSVPYMLVAGDVALLLREALEALRRQGQTSTKALRREAIIQSCCKHAVKAGDPLTHEEIQSLLDFFVESGTPLTCPHGRPVIVSISRRELEKMFKRVL